MENKLFTVEVWYRYYTNGEQEKEFKHFTVEAETEKQAIELALSNFKSNSAIPFKATIL